MRSSAPCGRRAARAPVTAGSLITAVVFNANSVSLLKFMKDLIKNTYHATTQTCAMINSNIKYSLWTIYVFSGKIRNLMLLRADCTFLLSALNM